MSPPIVCMSIAESLLSPFRTVELWTGDRQSQEFERSIGTVFPTSGVAENFRRLVTLAADGKLTIVGHNFAYDAACALQWIPDIAEPLFAAYERDRVVDTMLFERVAEIGKFTPRKVLSLQVVGAAYGIEMTKDKAIQTGYGSLYSESLSAYSQPAIDYPIADAVHTLTLLERQMRRHNRVNLLDVSFLARKQFWLQLVRNWGLKTDPARLGEMLEAVREHIGELQKLAQDAKIDLPVPEKKATKKKPAGTIESLPLLRADLSQDKRALKAWVLRAYEGKPPLTDTGEIKCKSIGNGGANWTYEQAIAEGYISTSGVTLQESGDFVLEQFAEYGEWSKLENPKTGKGLITKLNEGVEVPIHTKFGIADTTRTTSSDPNIQNFKRTGVKKGSDETKRKTGIRECFIPRKGCAFVGVDHGGLELATLAQAIIQIFGTRHMADMINSGIDLHCLGAKELLGLTYEETKARYEASDKDVKTKRNCQKVVNFGRPGYMGAETLVHYAKYSYGVNFIPIARGLGYEGADQQVAEAFARKLIKNWEATIPEGPKFLEYCKRLSEEAGGKCVVIPGTTIIRRGATLPAAANTHFQGLGAVLEAYVGWAIAKEMYASPFKTISGPGGIVRVYDSPLAHCRQVNFMHDEHFVEAPLDVVTAAGARLEHLMATVPRKKMPDVAIKSEAVASLRWSKDAERIIALAGRQLSPKEMSGRTLAELGGELIPWDEELPEAA